MDFKYDSFSNLPNDLVILIFSFLPLLDAFRLSLLKKQWFLLQLWKRCSSIEMEEKPFIKAATRQAQLNIGHPVHTTPHQLTAAAKLSFVEFFNRTVPRIITPKLYKFTFQVGFTKMDEENLNQWLGIALSKNVEELSINLSNEDSILGMAEAQYMLPDFFYQNGNSMRVLSLNTCGLGLCNYQSFINLKSLSLTRVGIMAMEMDDVLSCCPQLKTLTLQECYQLRQLEICSCGSMLRLERLVVRNCNALSFGIELCYVPRLKYFEYAGDLVRFSLYGLNGVEEVVLNFRILKRPPYQDHEIRGLLSGFSKARIFRVCTSALKVLPSEYLSSQPQLKLMNVEHLTLNTCKEPYELTAILSLLRSAPHLQTLFISMDFLITMNEYTHFDTHVAYPELPDEFWMQEQWTLGHLKRVNVKGFSGTKYEVDLLKFLLRNSTTLHKLLIKPLFRGNYLYYAKAFDDLKNAETASNHVIIKWR